MQLSSTARPQARNPDLAFTLTPARLIVLLSFMALAIRAIGLDSRPLWLDEAYSAWFASRGWKELWTVVPAYETHPPFYYSLLKLWSAPFGDSAVALRALSVLFGILAIPLAAACAKEQEHLDPTGRPLLRVGMAAFLCACSPALVFLDQEARPYPLMAFAYSIAILGLLRLLGEFREGMPGRLASWAMLAFGTELILWSHSLGALYAFSAAIALAPLWLARPKNVERLKRGLTAAILVLLAYLPCLQMVLARTTDWGGEWIDWHGAVLFQLLQLYLVPLDAFNIAAVVAALVIFALGADAIHHGLRTRGWNSNRVIVLLWLGPPFLAIIISTLWMPILMPRPMAATLIPASLAISGAVARVRSARLRLGMTTALAAILLSMSVQVSLQPPLEPWDKVNIYLSAHVKQGDEVWVYPNDSALALRKTAPTPRYVLRGIPAEYPALGVEGPIRSGSPAVVSLTQDQARRLAAAPETLKIHTIWLVTRQSRIFDPDDDLPRALLRTRHAGKVRQWGYIVIWPFTLNDDTNSVPAHRTGE
jgi:uncharacterized membrane protein